MTAQAWSLLLTLDMPFTVTYIYKHTCDRTYMIISYCEPMYDQHAYGSTHVWDHMWMITPYTEARTHIHTKRDHWTCHMKISKALQNTCAHCLSTSSLSSPLWRSQGSLNIQVLVPVPLMNQEVQFCSSYITSVRNDPQCEMKQWCPAWGLSAQHHGTCPKI